MPKQRVFLQDTTAPPASSHPILQRSFPQQTQQSASFVHSASSHSTCTGSVAVSIDGIPSPICCRPSGLSFVRTNEQSDVSPKKKKEALEKPQPTDSHISSASEADFWVGWRPVLGQCSIRQFRAQKHSHHDATRKPIACFLGN